MNDHDPFNDPETARPRARELMTEKVLWDCVDEDAPFGSDEGHDAYYEFRAWREEKQSGKFDGVFGLDHARRSIGEIQRSTLFGRKHRA